MATKDKQNIYCFINGKRPCTLTCRAAYKCGKEIYCSIIWGIKVLGYAISAAEEKVQKGIKQAKKG